MLSSGLPVKAALLSIFLLASACPEPEPPPREEIPIPLDSLCAEVARADCNRLNECGKLTPPFDLALCQLRQEQENCGPLAQALIGSSEAGSLDYFELSARDCRDAVAKLGCDVGFSHDLLDVPACRTMVTGKGEEGAACHLDLACAGGHCLPEQDGCPGECRKYKQNNETCRIGELCSPDTFCSVTGMRCQARVDLNGACELTLDNNPCRDGGFCDGSNPAQMRCVPVRGRGQGCNSSFECIVGARCVNNRCSAGEEGDTCVDSGDCRSIFVCHGGACRAPLAAEAPCSPTSIPCAEGLTCTSSVGMMACHPRPIAGGRCDQVDCYLSYCDNGTCAALIHPDEACMRGEQCFPSAGCRENICTVEPIDCTE